MEYFDWNKETNDADHLSPIAGFPPELWESARPDARAARIKQRLLTAERWVDVERARYTTRSYQRTEGQPMAIRRARMLLDLVREMSIAIYDDELIVGNRSLLPRMGVIAPEGAVDWVDRELAILPTRPQDRFNIGPEQIRELHEELFPYWRGKTLEDTVAARVPEEVARAVRGKAFSLNQTDHAQGHILPDVEGWLRLGIGGLRGQVEAARLRPGLTGEQHVFYEAACIALQAASEFVARYAALAERMAGDMAGSDSYSRPMMGGTAEAATANAITIEARREELLSIAARCRWLAEYPARDFREALQAIWFLFVLLQVESNASSFSPGRLDQYLLPYLEADLAAGRLDLTSAQGWLELLWLKFNEIVLLRSSASARYFAGCPIGFNVIVGGQRHLHLRCAQAQVSVISSCDATNILSYMCLRAQADLGLTQPNLSIRIHRDSPQEFLRAASAVIGRGGGMPQVFNDEVIIPGQVRRGVDPSDALNYAVVGCVELSTPGKALGWSDSAMFNMTRVLELTLFGGRDPQTGEQIGLPTPPLDEMESFDELEAAYDAQLAHFIGLMVQGCNVVDRIHAEMLPSPFLSLVIQDCVARGVDVTAGGAHYNFSGPQGVQIANVADSLAAIERAVFAERWLTRWELMQALRNDFAEQESLRQRLIHQAPKFGNDDDRVDRFAARWADRYSELVARYPTARGGTYRCGFYTVSAHVPMGANVGATPDGRPAGEPLADGGLSPFAGRDRRGPTAALTSVSKINLELASNGTLLNMKFLPSFFRRENALDKFVLLLRGFCRLRIPHVQFNVVSAETLRRAQSRPAEYHGLVVRVAGYSAYFTELDRALQDEIIARTEYTDM
jgi:pyruvate formate-lyase/glycerol dehydratase family glycyl radical enzyme